MKIMIKREKIISLKEFKENRKLVALDGAPYTGVCADYYDWENDQKEWEEYYKDGKENGLSNILPTLSDRFPNRNNRRKHQHPPRSRRWEQFATSK
jgi:antitoxin component YwqK of YwqJK toxin-antitoxin module